MVLRSAQLSVIDDVAIRWDGCSGRPHILIDAIMSNNELYELLSRTGTALGSYNLITSRIWLKENPVAKVNYRISNDEFIAHADDIARMMTFFHEGCHFYQAWGTSAGYLTFIMQTAVIDQISGFTKKTSFRLPLNKEFERALQAVRHGHHSDDDELFCAYFLSTRAVFRVLRWLVGDFGVHNPDLNAKFKGQFSETVDLFCGEPVFNVPTVDAAISMSGKTMPIFVFRDSDGDRTMTELGTRHLFEGFAKSVEYEHYFNFNPDIAKDWISWFLSQDALEYTAALRLFLISLEGRQVPYTFANFRVLVDLALMHSDILRLKERFRDNEDRRYLHDVMKIQTHPGETFLRSLDVFSRCTPLRDFEEDTMRLYNDVCSLLGIAGPDEMLAELVELVEALLETYFPEHLATHQFVYNGLNVVKAKQKDPVAFINGLISPDGFNELVEKVRWKLPVRIGDDVPKKPFDFEYIHAGDVSTILAEYDGYLLEAAYAVCMSVLRTSDLKCPLVEKYGWCILPKGDRDGCIGNGTSSTWSTKCELGCHISAFKRGKDQNCGD